MAPLILLWDVITRVHPTKPKGQEFLHPFAAHELLEKYQDEIGIQIVKSQAIVYVKEDDRYMALPDVPEGKTVLSISGTEQRRLLETRSEIPAWFSFPNVVEELRKDFKPPKEQGLCVYFVGLSGSGKTSMLRGVSQRLMETRPGKKITILDADIVRQHLSKGLGFSKEDRSTNVRRIGYVAHEVVKHGGICLCANIAPYQEDRAFNRDLISSVGRYVEVFVDADLEACEARDIKGLYKLAREGKIKQFTGISDPFERPESAEVHVKNNQLGDLDINTEKC